MLESQDAEQIEECKGKREACNFLRIHSGPMMHDFVKHFSRETYLKRIHLLQKPCYGHLVCSIAMSKRLDQSDAPTSASMLYIRNSESMKKVPIHRDDVSQQLLEKASTTATVFQEHVYDDGVRLMPQLSTRGKD